MNNDELQSNIEKEKIDSTEESFSCLNEQSDPVTESEHSVQSDSAQTGDSASAVTAENTRGRWSRLIDVALWVLVIVLAVAVVLRAFVFGRITISGSSMTNDFYSKEQYSLYNPELTYFTGQVVRVNKVRSPQRGDVIVFYKFHVDSKFRAMFASGKDVEQDGKYEKLIKRMVAVGGDAIWAEQTGENEYRLVIKTAEGNILHEDYYQKNGTLLDEKAFVITYKDLGRLRDTSEENPYRIDDGYFFAIGDNRGNSKDSRGEFGVFPLDQMYGVVI